MSEKNGAPEIEYVPDKVCMLCFWRKKATFLMFGLYSTGERSIKLPICEKHAIKLGNLGFAIEKI